jgi:hypothetical protein
MHLSKSAAETFPPRFFFAKKVVSRFAAGPTGDSLIQFLRRAHLLSGVSQTHCVDGNWLPGASAYRHQTRRALAPPNRNRARIGAPHGQGCAGAKPAPGPRNMVLAWPPLSIGNGPLKHRNSFPIPAYCDHHICDHCNRRRNTPDYNFAPAISPAQTGEIQQLTKGLALRRPQSDIHLRPGAALYSAIHWL